jgi:3-oxoacyl-[acyl-carrier protein] reductase
VTSHDQGGKLSGQVALVTGGSRGIGRAIALELAATGAGVAVNYRSGKDQADDVVKQIQASGGRAVAVAGDVGEFDEAGAMVERTVEALGGLHILVNNAGISKDSLIYNMSPDDVMAVLRVNFLGVFNCTRAVLAVFMRQRSGAIVNVSSVTGDNGFTGESNYAASKGAVNAFTRCAAIELIRFGIRVNAVVPGFVPTELVSGLLEHKDGGKGILNQIPARSFTTGEQVAKGVAFLAGPDAEGMTGALMPIDGGLSAALGLGRPR